MPTEPASAPSHAPEALDRPDATVACGACRTCCTGTNVALFTGDDLDLYEHKAWLHDINPETDAFYRSHDPAFAGYVLKRDATNTCVYMTEAGARSITRARSPAGPTAASTRSVASSRFPRTSATRTAKSRNRRFSVRASFACTQSCSRPANKLRLTRSDASF